jgi:hypothetical protein
MNLPQCSTCKIYRNGCSVDPQGVMRDDGLDFRLKYETEVVFQTHCSGFLLKLMFSKSPAKDFRQSLRLHICINPISSLAIMFFLFRKKFRLRPICIEKSLFLYMF